MQHYNGSLPCESHLTLLRESSNPNHPLCFSSLPVGVLSGWSSTFPVDLPLPLEKSFFFCFLLWLPDSDLDEVANISSSSSSSFLTIGPLCSRAAAIAAFSSTQGLSKDQRRPSPAGPVWGSEEVRGLRFCRDMERGEDFCKSPGHEEFSDFPEPQSRTWTSWTWLPLTHTVGLGTAMVMSPASSPKSHWSEDDLGDVFAVCSKKKREKELIRKSNLKNLGCIFRGNSDDFTVQVWEWLSQTST